MLAEKNRRAQNAIGLARKPSRRPYSERARADGTSESSRAQNASGRARTPPPRPECERGRMDATSENGDAQNASGLARRPSPGGKAIHGGAQNASGLARTPHWPLEEFYQEVESVKTPVFYQQKFTTTKNTIW